MTDPTRGLPRRLREGDGRSLTELENPEGMYTSVSRGSPLILSGLETLLETGEPLAGWPWVSGSWGPVCAKRARGARS